MTLSIEPDEILGLVRVFRPDLATTLALASSTDGFEVRARVGPLSIRLLLTAGLREDGIVEIDIASATISGLSVFGIVRKKAKAMILANLAPFDRYVRAAESPNGNIAAWSPLVVIKGIAVGAAVSIEI